MVSRESLLAHGDGDPPIRDQRHQFNFVCTATFHCWANCGASAALLSAIPFDVTTGRGVAAAVVDLRWCRDVRLLPAKKGQAPDPDVQLELGFQS